MSIKQSHISLETLEDLEKPFYYIDCDHVRSAFGHKAIEKFGNDVEFGTREIKPKISGMRVGKPVQWNYVVRKPRSWDDVKKDLFYDMSFEYRSLSIFFESLDCFDCFSFRNIVPKDLKNIGYSDELVVKFNNNNCDCHKYYDNLEKLWYMVKNGIDAAVASRHNSVVYMDINQPQYGIVNFGFRDYKDYPKITARLLSCRSEIKTVMDNVRTKLMPLEKECIDLWANKWGGHRDIMRVACLYLYCSIAQNPLQYLESKNPAIRKCANRLISGI